MSDNERGGISRRGFVRSAGAAALGAAVTSTPAAAAEETDAGKLPRRVLGKTGLSVTCMTLGTAPAGIAKTILPKDVAKVVNQALDLGVNFVDTSPKYGNAEEGVGLALGRRRKRILLATKVWADTVTEAEKSLAKSGRCRFVGISGHHLPDRFPAFLETGQVDAILVNLNFVDRHTYDFQEKVLPLARKHNVGIVAMKVFGGPDPATGSWGTPEAKPYVGEDRVALAVRYALSIPGVATVNLGVHNIEQVRRNVEIVNNFRPLSSDEQQMLAKLGQELAAKWGEHFGPVNEEEEPVTG